MNMREDNGNSPFSPSIGMKAIEPFISGVDGRELFICSGYNDELVGQLVEKSRQKAILESTPRDAGERFSDVAAFQAWLTRDKSVYCLVDESGDLAGLAWFSPEELPGRAENHTFAIRLYDGYRGQGLAKPFMLATLRYYIDELTSDGLIAGCEGFWLETNADNVPALSLYKTFGYTEVKSRRAGRVAMVLPIGAAMNISQAK